MTREEIKKMLPILQAFAEGKTIECRIKPSSLKGSDTPNGWTAMKDFEFWNNTEYRIKPAPKYRPFKNTKECWQEMLKHQPFGWTRDKDYDIYDMVTRVTDSGILFAGSYFNEIATYDFSYDRVTFADGTPFGIKESSKRHKTT